MYFKEDYPILIIFDKNFKYSLCFRYCKCISSKLSINEIGYANICNIFNDYSMSLASKNLMYIISNATPYSRKSVCNYMLQNRYTICNVDDIGDIIKKCRKYDLSLCTVVKNYVKLYNSDNL